MGFLGDVAKGIVKAAAKANNFVTVKDLVPNQIGVYIMSYQKVPLFKEQFLCHLA